MRRPRHISNCTGSTTNLIHQNHNGSSENNESLYKTTAPDAHQRLTRFLSNRYSGSFQLHNHNEINKIQKIINESGESLHNKASLPLLATSG